jgi:molybdate transport system permease protein
MTGWLSPEEWGIVALSLRVSMAAVLLTMPVAYGLAWLLARRRFPGRILLDALVHLPLVLPPVVTGWLLLIVFGTQGPVGSWLQAQFGLTLVFRWTGAALAAAVMALPLMVRAMRLSIEAVDRRLVDAARTLGAGRWRRCSVSRDRSASSARRSPSRRTSRARHGHCRWRFTAGCSCPARKRL